MIGRAVWRVRYGSRGWLLFYRDKGQAIHFARALRRHWGFVVDVARISLRRAQREWADYEWPYPPEPIRIRKGRHKSIRRR